MLQDIGREEARIARCGLLFFGGAACAGRRADRLLGYSPPIVAFGKNGSDRCRMPVSLKQAFGSATANIGTLDSTDECGTGSRAVVALLVGSRAVRASSGKRGRAQRRRRGRRAARDESNTSNLVRQCCCCGCRGDRRPSALRRGWVAAARRHRDRTPWILSGPRSGRGPLVDDEFAVSRSRLYVCPDATEASLRHRTE